MRCQIFFRRHILNQALPCLDMLVVQKLSGGEKEYKIDAQLQAVKRLQRRLRRVEQAPACQCCRTHHLHQRLAELGGLVGKDSHNSGLPPSSDPPGARTSQSLSDLFGCRLSGHHRADGGRVCEGALRGSVAKKEFKRARACLYLPLCSEPEQALDGRFQYRRRSRIIPLS